MTYKKNRNKISKEKQKAISQNGGIIMLVTTKEMFKKSMEEGFAIGAFNVNNMEIIQGIVDAAAESKSPVILQASSSAIKYARIGYLMKMVQAAVEEHPEVPIAIIFLKILSVKSYNFVFIILQLLRIESYINRYKIHL